MKKLSVFAGICIILLVGIFVAVKMVKKYKWEINFLLYGKQSAKRQEFIYHTNTPLKKVIGKSSPEHPNIILISLDTLRAQSMSCYKFNRQTSPFMDQLAREGVLFENMCAAATSTPPSHMSMMTGMYLKVHGVLNKQVLSPNIKTLAEVLSSAGYATGAVTEDGFLVRDMGFGRGFDDYYEIKDVMLFEKLMVAGGFAKDVFERAREWIGERLDQRFFLFLHTYEVHAPYFPPEPYNTMFLENADRYKQDLIKYREYKGRLNINDFPVEFSRAQYEGEIRYVDELIKNFVKFLKTHALHKKTLLIITSDHGEEFFEHDAIKGHGYYTYDTEAHIPFIMWMPGRIPSGIHIKNQVSNVDIFPTIVDFLKLELTERVQGQSLCPLIANPKLQDERYVFCEAINQTCVRSLTYKFIDTGELYFYDADPQERVNVAGTHQEVCLSATKLLKEFSDECQSLKIMKGLFAPGETVSLDEKDIEKLKALGYIQ